MIHSEHAFTAHGQRGPYSASGPKHSIGYIGSPYLFSHNTPFFHTSTMLPPLSLQEPPTAARLTAARATLEDSLKNASSLAEKISAAEVALAQIVAERELAIEDMVREKATLDETIVQTRAYLSPIRRLPGELLRELFLWCFEDHPCCAWVLSTVCTTWRQQALLIPRIWSKIRLFTNQSSSPDTIRLWLERAGPIVPLDIEIYLRVVHGTEAPPLPPHPRRRRAHDMFAHPFAPAPPPPLFGTGPLGAPTPFMVPHFTPSVTPFIVPQSPIHHGWESPPLMVALHGQQPDLSVPPNLHWGHIAVYYLVQQMHRWERFVFRFDKGFGSLAALKSITGPAPLLKEFEVSSASAVFYAHEWTWLPSSPSSPLGPAPLPQLTSLTLQNAPFTTLSPIFLQPQTHLTNLTLRALPTATIPLDRLLRVLTANAATLSSLNLHVVSVAPALLPLPTSTTLPALVDLAIGGHHLLTGFLDTFVLPSLRDLDLDFDSPRDPVEETIAGLWARSGNPPLRSLAISYGPSPPPSASSSSSSSNSSLSSPSSSFSSTPAFPPPLPMGGGPWYPHHYYVSAGPVVSWAFLAECGAALEVLKVGGAAVEGLLAVLGAEDGGMGVPPPLVTTHPSLQLNPFTNTPANPNANPNNNNNGNNNGGGWTAPALRELHLRSGCPQPHLHSPFAHHGHHMHPLHGHGHVHGHSHHSFLYGGGHGGQEGVGRLVRVVDVRNPEGGVPGTWQGGAGSPARITQLSLEDCVPLDRDVVRWLEGRIGKGGVRVAGFDWGGGEVEEE
ncbi:hypothetical protein C8R45DRAFT_1008237 [Mycena sanguinolenta]|nr:hypothetical protein C8R45DRAFT_1008237 [Mycena sanguinolenta]